MDDNVNDHSLLNPKRFLPIFGIQFLNAMSDHLLKNAILVIITFQGLTIANLSSELSVNIATLLFILPFFFLSPYAGRVADTHSKVKLIRIIKYCEILIVLIAALGFLLQHIYLILLSLLAMGVHSTFFSPLKYSILPQYIEKRSKLLLASGYVEMGTFVAVLLGQFMGSWFMANEQLLLVVGGLALSLLFALLLSYNLAPTPPASNEREPFSWNVFREMRSSYRKVNNYPELKICIHAISWFWSMGVVYTTQLPLFTAKFMGGSAHVFSVFLAIFSIAIGFGSVICAKISNGHIKHQFVFYGALSMTLFSTLLLALDHNTQSAEIGLITFSYSWFGALNYLLIFLIGFSAGFYSVTCYNELQVVSPLKILSQVIATNNIINAAYVLLISVLCTLLLIVIDVWWLFVVINGLNLIFLQRYYALSLRKKISLA